MSSMGYTIYIFIYEGVVLNSKILYSFIKSIGDQDIKLVELPGLKAEREIKQK